jgi:hypothetical protein
VAEFQQAGMRQSQRGWSILLQTVPGASRSVCRISHLHGGMPTGGTPCWPRQPGRLSSKKKFKFLKIILATAKKTRFVRNACWDSAPHFILPLRLWLQSLTDFQALISKHEIRNKEKSPTSRIRQKCPSSNPKSLLSSSSSSSFQPSTFNLQPSTFNLQPSTFNLSSAPNH